MTDVTPIRPGLQIEQNDTSEALKLVIAHLEDLLERAKAGEIIGVGVVTLNKDWSAGSGIAGHTGMASIGATVKLQQMMLRHQEGLPIELGENDV